MQKRIPKYEAVTISGPRESETYATVIKSVTDKVKLKDIGMQVGKVRKT